MKETKNRSVAEEVRRLGVVIEHVDDKVSLIAEQYGDIKNTLDEHTKILDEHTRILDEHTRILIGHTEMIGSLKEDMEVIKMDIEFIKTGFKKKVDIDEFAALERRVALLEKRK